MNSIHVSDLHGNRDKYQKLSRYIQQNLPEAVFITGDLLPNFYVTEPEEFVLSFLKPLLSELKVNLKDNYPAIFVITGNDDPAAACGLIYELDTRGLLTFLNNKTVDFKDYKIFGYPYVPPTPFQLKDWEKYDVSRYVPRGALSPEEGYRTVEIPLNIIQHSIIKDDLSEISIGLLNANKVIGLFHTPPINSNLDKLIGNNINGQKEAVSAGSFAVRRFIENTKPFITLHGHLHESTDLSSSWKDKIRDTYCFNAAHAGGELAVIEFDTDEPGNAIRELI